jgi:hypothetical protein
MAGRRDTERAIQLVRDVILAQSNVFIKELLISRNIYGGVTKADFELQLEDAITDGSITYDELKAWVDETEGWGDEHVYLYKVATSVERLLSDSKYAEERARKAGFETAWNADTSLKFPTVRKLTAIQHSEGELTCVWHQDTPFEKRAKEKDFLHDDPDGEQYLYKAWRIAHRRNVTRIVIRPRLAAIFLPSASEPKTHADERASLMKEISEFISMHDWPIYSMGEAIKVLDAASMRPAAKGLRARHTRLDAKGGGSVEFMSDTDMSYADVEPLREVRGAVSPTKFKGAVGEFQFALPIDGKEKQGVSVETRSVKVQLYGAFDRIRLWVRLTRADVWWILRKIPKRGT